MTGEAPEVVPTMMAAADTESGEISFEQFVPLLRDQLGAAAPTTGWGHQSEEDVIAQLLENDATMAKYEHCWRTESFVCNTVRHILDTVLTSVHFLLFSVAVQRCVHIWRHGSRLVAPHRVGLLRVARPTLY